LAQVYFLRLYLIPLTCSDAAMRSFILASSISGTACASMWYSLPGERDLTDYVYDDYVKEFAKGYEAEEHTSRKQIFESNLERIREHNSNPAKTWFMNVNEFADWSNEEFRAKRLGAIPDLDKSMFLGEFQASNIEDLPASVDWRTKKGVMTPVKDQGGCGSCWAFSTVQTLESHLAIATGEDAPILSPQQIVSCAPNPKDCGGTGGCSGSIQTLGFNYTETAGITTEADYPYRGETGTCQQNKIKAVAKNTGYIKLKVNDYATLVSAVATKGPIAISLAAASFGMYGGGVLTECDCVQDHAVQLVGYGVDSSLGDYWLVRNSWGSGWGEKGYIRIKRFGDGKEPTCIDKKPSDGEACKGDTKPRTYAGLCGIMGSSSYPTGMKKLAPTPGPSLGPSPGPSRGPAPTPGCKDTEDSSYCGVVKSQGFCSTPGSAKSRCQKTCGCCDASPPGYCGSSVATAGWVGVGGAGIWNGPSVVV